MSKLNLPLDAITFYIKKLWGLGDKRAKSNLETGSEENVSQPVIQALFSNRILLKSKKVRIII